MDILRSLVKKTITHEENKGWFHRGKEKHYVRATSTQHKSHSTLEGRPDPRAIRGVVVVWSGSGVGELGRSRLG